jgi:hypothetical protein
VLNSAGVMRRIKVAGDEDASDIDSAGGGGLSRPVTLSVDDEPLLL